MVALKKLHPNRTTYRDAGVDIDAGDQFVRSITPIAEATGGEFRPGPVGGIGGFGALFDLKSAGFRDPILVSSTDGVGTKLRIAIETGKLNTIGIDLVAMCVNDILVHGAEPLFFLDYYACGMLEEEPAKQVIEGIAAGCKMAGAALVGGETAEMPSFYRRGDFDLAGFAVGAVERGCELPRLNDMVPGDVLIGLKSSGIHSNGYSLVRKIVAEAGLEWGQPAPFDPTTTIGDSCLTPTRIYVRSVLNALRHTDGIKAMAHITGSGALGKLHRILPSPRTSALRAHIQLGSWKVPKIFDWLRSSAGLDNSMPDQRELLRSFNCGIGMVLVVAHDEAETVQSVLRLNGEDPCVIGEIEQLPESIEAWAKTEDAVRLSGRLSFES